MREVGELVIVSAPLRRDEEERRWYSDGAGACLVLTKRGRLLEPHPIFGPTSYRLLARQIGAPEARSYAFAHEFWHERVLRGPAAR